MAGFEGIACSRLSCPAGCSGNGECETMRYHASQMDLGLQPLNYFYSYTSNWDANMIQGCACDTSYTGYDCSLRECPKGDDPMTINQVNEVELIRCDLNPNTSPYNVAAFTLYFEGSISVPFSGLASTTTIANALQALPTVGTVAVSFSHGTTFCDASALSYANVGPPLIPAGMNIVSITFLSNHGPQPSLVVLDQTGALLTGVMDNSVWTAYGGASLPVSIGLGAISTVTSVVGNKEDVYCSNRGLCSRVTGECTCSAGFYPSDGMGASGTINDCGYVPLNGLGAPYPVITTCPGSPIACSGHGTCNSGNSLGPSLTPDYTCTCNAGYQGADCSERTCPFGAAWFDFPSAVDTAHASAECSHRGLCNRATGLCACQAGFDGSACERMACPAYTSAAGVCSGQGTCRSMTHLASHASVNGEHVWLTYGANPNSAATWDGSHVYGCQCDAGYTGYDCSQMTCATGEDVTLQEWNPTVSDEIQSLTCVWQGIGTPFFVLKFRDAKTADIPYSADAATIAAALEASGTIGTIVVTQTIAGTQTAATQACGLAPGVTTTFAFETEHGDVPPIRVVMTGYSAGYWSSGYGFLDTQLTWTGGDPSTAPDFSGTHTYLKGLYGYEVDAVASQEVVKGTTVATTCSSRGLCNSATGTCLCFTQYGMSDGMRGPGTVDDCGWREGYWPVGLIGAGGG